MFEMDHVAIPTQDVRGTAKYYVETFGAAILYVDDTWAFLRVGQGKLALVRREQHPPHVALRVDFRSLEEAAKRDGKGIDKHRDGTQGIYVNDPAGNVVELIYYPAGETLYDGAATDGTSRAGTKSP